MDLIKIESSGLCHFEAYDLFAVTLRTPPQYFDQFYALGNEIGVFLWVLLNYFANIIIDILFIDFLSIFYSKRHGPLNFLIL